MKTFVFEWEIWKSNTILKYPFITIKCIRFEASKPEFLFAFWNCWELNLLILYFEPHALTSQPIILDIFEACSINDEMKILYFKME